MSARWRLVPVELPTTHIVVNGEPVHELHGPVADVYAALVGGAPKASEDAELVSAVEDAILRRLRKANASPAEIARAVLKLLEGAQ